jgi:hypothetical protein
MAVVGLVWDHGDPRVIFFLNLLFSYTNLISVSSQSNKMMQIYLIKKSTDV